MCRECRAVSPPPRVSDPDMHHGTCVTHVPWSMSGSLTSGFLWSRWRGKRSRHSRLIHNPQFYVSGKSPTVTNQLCNLMSDLAGLIRNGPDGSETRWEFMASHERHGSTNHRRLECFFSSLFRLILKNNDKENVKELCHWPFVVGRTGGFPWNRPVMRQAFPCLAVTRGKY